MIGQIIAFAVSLAIGAGAVYGLGPILTADAETVTGRAEVVDGDTIRVDGQLVRLFGINAPEVIYPAGKKSQAALEGFVAGQEVECQVQGKSYKRKVAICYLGAVDIGQYMVFAGWALNADRWTSTYTPMEADAAIHCRGMWAIFCVPEGEET